MEKLKQFLKRVRIPAAALAMIVAGAAALTGAISAGQENENKKTVLLAHTPAPAATAVQAPAPTWEPAKGKIYRVFDVLDENSFSPGAEDIDYLEAASNAADIIETLFGDTLANETLYSQYTKYEGIVNGIYVVRVGSAKDTEAKYSVSMDATSGVIRSAMKFAPEVQQTKQDGLEDVDAALMEEARENVSAVTPAVVGLISDKFADGREVVEVMVDGIQWEFNNPAYDVVMDCKVRMSEGACYMVRLTYPGGEIIEFDAYPLGWDACLNGYSYLPQEPAGTGQEPAAERPTPAPTPREQ